MEGMKPTFLTKRNIVILRFSQLTFLLMILYNLDKRSVYVGVNRILWIQ